MPLSSQEWFDRFVADLASAIGAIGEGAATAVQGTEPPSDGWVVTLRADRGSRGELFVEFDRAGIEALAKRVMGTDEDPSHEVVADTLKELCTQAAGTMVLKPPFVGSRLALVSVDRAAGAAAGSVLAQITIGEIALPLRLWGDIALPAGPRAMTPAASPPTPPETPKLDVILDIDLPLTVRFGRTQLPLRLVAALGPGSVIDLGRSPDDPVDVLVGNQLVARGEVVIVGGNYGVRITDVFSQENGVRSLEERFR